MQRHQHEAADDPQSRRDRSAIGEKRDLLDTLERMRTEMRALDDAVKAETVGAPYQVEIISQVLNHVAGRMLAANDQAEFHRPRSTAMPFSASSRLAFSFLSSARPMPRS